MIYLEPQTADFFRFIYATLSIVVACGLAATIVIRWDLLHRGEKILRVGLIAEHVVITYGAYTALQLDYPPTIVGLAATMALSVTLTGFVVWLADIVTRGDDGPKRLTDRH